MNSNQEGTMNDIDILAVLIESLMQAGFNPTPWDGPAESADPDGDMLAAAAQPDAPAEVRAGGGYVQMTMGRDDFDGNFYPVDMINAFLAGVAWADEHTADSPEWAPSPQDSVFALLSGTSNFGGGAEVRFTLTPADRQRVVDWNLGGGVTLSPGKIIRA